MTAASKGSLGKFFNPASRTSIINGDQCQTSTKISAGMTVAVLDAHSDGPRPTREKR